MVTHENFLLHLKDMQINKILPPKPFIIYKYAGARKHFILAGKSTSLSSYSRLGMKSLSKPSLTKSRKILHGQPRKSHACTLKNVPRGSRTIHGLCSLFQGHWPAADPGYCHPNCSAFLVQVLWATSVSSHLPLTVQLAAAFPCNLLHDRSVISTNS